MKKDTKEIDYESQLSEEQLAVLSDINGIKNILVTGSAGTGKSFLLKAIRKQFLDNKINLAVCGSTGIAAVNVNGLTLHTWAGLGLAKGDPEVIVEKIRQNKKAFSNLTRINHLALDEISMISGSLFQKLDKVFRMVRGRLDEPFGGMQLIMFGDFLQLPPVSTSAKRPEKFAFQTKAWKDAKIKTHLLSKVFRQEELEFSKALDAVRIGEFNESVSKILNDCYQKEDKDPTFKPVVLHTHNKDADLINKSKLGEIDSELVDYEAKDEGSKKALKALERCLLPKTLELKVGAQVMLCVNLEQDQGLVNGTLGKVVGFSNTFRELPIIEFQNGKKRTLELHEWKVDENGKTIGYRVQIPVRLAWAITVHKSQGMTLEKVEVHLGKAFEYGQSYVALSRAKTKEGLFIANGSRKSIKAHPDALKFYKDLTSPVIN